jgi:SAM-dependent methyltransferase
MYERIKKIAQKLLPKSLFMKYEDSIRSIIAFRYKGSSYQCTICEFKMSSFIVLQNKENLCPKCGSIPRSRRLFNLLKPNLNQQKVLHFSPPKPFAKELRKILGTNYVTSDFMGEFSADKNYNIENIDDKELSYDLIICYHVLEHIEKDIKAMHELFRVLRKGGVAYIQCPFKEGATYEDSSIVSEKERTRHFGQKDHVRIYSINGLLNRLTDVGFECTVMNLKAEPLNYNGWQESENMILAKKPA